MTTRRILQISVAIGLMVLLWVNLDVPEAFRSALTSFWAMNAARG